MLIIFCFSNCWAIIVLILVAIKKKLIFKWLTLYYVSGVAQGRVSLLHRIYNKFNIVKNKIATKKNT
jgi:hypothetical protein